jgi:hypothetical protein
MGLQPKLRMNELHDAWEQEAERAEEVLVKPAHVNALKAPARLQCPAGQLSVQTRPAPASVEHALNRKTFYSNRPRRP